MARTKQTARKSTASGAPRKMRAFLAARQSTTDSDTDQGALRLFISGDHAQVGKSTVALGFIGALLLNGFAAHEIAYIQPVAQCVSPHLVGTFCKHHEVSHVVGSPVLLPPNFIRRFVCGKTDETTKSLLDKMEQAVEEVAENKKIVVIDGMGGSSMGSVCGLSHAVIARAMRASVLLVGGSGVADAIDAFNLHASFFESQGVHVLGAVFNRLLSNGFDSLTNCRASVKRYFDEHQRNRSKAYGFVPELEIIEPATDVCHAETADDEMSAVEELQARQVVGAFVADVDVAQLLQDIAAHQPAEF